MNSEFVNILLADDDQGDRILFKEALNELPLTTRLTTVNDGEQLMHYLYKNSKQLPDVLFLDLNMHRKNGFECLSEIKQIEELKQLPVIIVSTSAAPDVVNMLYKNGARLYLHKPCEFQQLRTAIYNALATIIAEKFVQPPRENLVLTDV